MAQNCLWQQVVLKHELLDHQHHLEHQHLQHHRHLEQRPRAAFDLETTGRNSRAARIVTASVTVVDAEGSVVKEHEWLADPGVEIPAEASEVHGVTTEKAAATAVRPRRSPGNSPRCCRACSTTVFPVIAFNASYDFTVLAAESARYGIPQLNRFPVLDPYIMNKQVDRYRKGKRTLTALCEEYGVNLDNAHTSAADALATLRMLDAMAGKFPKLRMPASQLHQLQVGLGSYARPRTSSPTSARPNPPP